MKPRIPSDSCLLLSSTLVGCVEAFNRENGSSKPVSHEEESRPVRPTKMECKASLHYDDSALCVHLGSQHAHGAVWVFLRTVRRDGTSENGSDSRLVEVDRIRMSASDARSVGQHFGSLSGISDNTTQRGFIDTVSSSNPYSILSSHLTELHLSLPELLV